VDDVQEAIQLLIGRMRFDGSVGNHTAEEVDLAFEVLFAAGGERR
jgi:hypothetical protein